MVSNERNLLQKQDRSLYAPKYTCLHLSAVDWPRTAAPLESRLCSVSETAALIALGGPPLFNGLS